MDQHRNALKPGYQLHWYHIREILGQGGFGITYLAHDDNLNQPVAIKEYLPVELAVRQDAISVQPVSGEHGEQFRWGLERFINEAQTLARFRHPNIVRVLTVFKENNTAYMVMEYEKGMPLHEILKDRKTLTEKELKGIVLPILDGLAKVHAENFIHRDIKPANIYIREDQSPVLLDFGSARQSLGELTRTLTTMISPGYAPFEQYVSKSRKQGSWTDIYGLGATLYRAVTGIAPPDSLDRSEAILHTGKDIFVPAREIAAGRYTEEFLSAIDHAMAFKPEDRPQTISAWRKELGAVAGPILSASTVDEDITVPVINTGRDTGRTRAPASLQNDRTPAPAVVQPPLSPVPAEAEASIDRAYGVIKRLLKWLLVLFIILVVVLVLTRRKSHDTDVESTITPPALEQEPPAVAEEKPRDATPAIPSVDTGPSDMENLLAAARDDLAANRMIAPAGNNALEKFRRVLELDQRNKEAAQGIDTIVSRYLGLMDGALDTGKLSLAQNYFDKATAVNAEYAGIPAARLRLEAAQAKQVPPAPAPGPEPQMKETVAEPVSAPVSEPVSTPVIVPEPGTRKAEEPVTTVSAPAQPAVPENQIPESKRAELQSIKERLRRNPQDREARQELRVISKDFEENIRVAMNTGNYTLAKDYIREVQSVTSGNSRAWRRLQELMRVIEEKESQAGGQAH